MRYYATFFLLNALLGLIVSTTAWIIIFHAVSLFLWVPLTIFFWAAYYDEKDFKPAKIHSNWNKRPKGRYEFGPFTPNRNGKLKTGVSGVDLTCETVVNEVKGTAFRKYSLSFIDTRDLDGKEIIERFAAYTDSLKSGVSSQSTEEEQSTTINL